MAKETTTTTSDSRPSFITPALKASYPRLVVPDTKFDADGVLHCKLIATAEQAEEIRNIAIKQAQEFVQSDIQKNPKHKVGNKAGPVNVSINPQQDDKGEETGLMLIKFNQRAKVPYVDKKTGQQKVWNVHLPFFDAKGAPVFTHDKSDNLLDSAPRIGGGSVLKICYEVATSYQADKKCYHATLRPKAVQIIELVAPAMTHQDADEFGFGEEEGYTAPAFPTGNSAPATSSETEEAPVEQTGNY